MLRFLTTADTEILATAAAVGRLPRGFPAVRCANPATASDPRVLVDELLDGARVVVCRILGGRRGWPEGFDLLRQECARRDIALLALGGEAEPDAELTALSLAPAGAVAQAGEYLRHGDVDNVEQLLRFLADTFLLQGHGFEPPHVVPDFGIYRRDPASPGRPTVGLCFYRSHFLTGNTEFVDAFCQALHEAGAGVFAVWSYTLRRDSAGRVPALELMAGQVDALVVTMLATGGSTPADDWDASALAALDVPVIQAVCATGSRAAWEASASGLTPLDAATQVAIPEFDGRLLGGVISFKERDGAGSPVGGRGGGGGGGHPSLPLRGRPRAVGPRGPPGGPPRPAPPPPGGPAAGRGAPDELPHQARPRRDGGGSGYPGQCAGAARCAGRGRHAGGPPVRDRR